MALPIITSNSPSAGYIAWTAFGIQYNGVAYSVAASNSNKKYISWLYNAGAPTLVASDTQPVLTADDELLFLNKGGVGLFLPTASVVDGSLIVGGSILAGTLGVNSVVAGNINANAVTAGTIAADVVVASTIAAGAVTTSKLSVGSVGDNMVANGSFEDGIEGWVLTGGGGTSTAGVVTGVSSSGANAIALTRGTANCQVTQDPKFFIPVTASAGRKWWVSALAGAGSTLTGAFYFRVFWYQANKVTAASTAYVDVAAYAALSTTWTTFEGQVTPPANARYMALSVYNTSGTSTIYVDEVAAAEVITSAIIGNGAVSTPQLNATAIDGMTITGALIRTAASGQRTELTTAGLKGYDASNAVKTAIGTDGKLTADGATISGSLTTGVVGAGQVIINGDSATFKSPNGYASTISSSDNGASGTRLVITGGSGGFVIGKTDLYNGLWADVTTGYFKADRIYADVILDYNSPVGASGYQSFTPVANTMGYTSYFKSSAASPVRLVTAFGMCHLSGWITNALSVNTTSGTAIQIGTLPAGCIPAQEQLIVIESNIGNFTKLSVKTSGAVYWTPYGTGSYAADVIRISAGVSWPVGGAWV